MLGAKQGAENVDHNSGNVIIRAMHEAFIKYPEADGGQNLDYQWIQPEQSSHVAKP